MYFLTVTVTSHSCGLISILFLDLFYSLHFIQNLKLKHILYLFTASRHTFSYFVSCCSVMIGYVLKIKKSNKRFE